MDNTNNIEVDRPGGKAKTVSNYGYGDAGASWKKRALKSFLANSSSSHEDIDWNNYTLRQRARMLYMAAPLATSAIKTNRTNVIGCGLRLKAKPNAELLGITQEQADAWEARTEAEFDLWARKNNHVTPLESMIFTACSSLHSCRGCCLVMFSLF